MSLRENKSRMLMKFRVVFLFVDVLIVNVEVSLWLFIRR